MDVLASRIALTVRAPGGHKDINFEVTISMTERNLLAGAEVLYGDAEDLRKETFLGGRKGCGKRSIRGACQQGHEATDARDE